MQLTFENVSMPENDKSDLGGSDLSGVPKRNGVDSNNTILSGLPNLDNREFMPSGFKTLPHSSFQSPVWKSANFKYRCFFLEILMRCVWKDTEFVFNGHKITLKKGQFACSIRKMAHIFSPDNHDGKNHGDKFTADDIRGCIKYFRNQKWLHQQVLHQISILTIIDSDIYDSNFNFIPTAIPTTDPTVRPQPSKRTIKPVKPEDSSPQPLINEGLSPIIPQGDDEPNQPSKKDSTKKRPRKVKAEKFEREPFVKTTEIQHQSLVKIHGDVMVSLFYKRLSKWKADNEVGDLLNDYRVIGKWVIGAVEKDLQKPVSSVAETNWTKNQQFIREVMQAFPQKTQGMYFYYKEKILRHQGHPFDLQGDMPHEDFVRLVCNHLKISMEISDG